MSTHLPPHQPAPLHPTLQAHLPAPVHLQQAPQVAHLMPPPLELQRQGPQSSRGQRNKQQGWVRQGRVHRRLAWEGSSTPDQCPGCHLPLQFKGARGGMRSHTPPHMHATCRVASPQLTSKHLPSQVCRP